MSNPTGNALVAIGIVDTQKLSGNAIRRALLRRDLPMASYIPRSHIGRLALAIAAVMVVVFVI